jgi:hypothetical protein
VDSRGDADRFSRYQLRNDERPAVVVVVGGRWCRRGTDSYGLGTDAEPPKDLQGVP